MNDVRSTGEVGAVERRRQLRPDTLPSSGFRAPGSSRGALVYAIIGMLAFKLAVGHGGKLTNQQGAMRTVAHQPFGGFLLSLRRARSRRLLALAAVRAALGRGPEGADRGFDRIAALGSGLAYGALCVSRSRSSRRRLLVGQHITQEVDGRRPRLAHGCVDRRARRRGPGRHRALPGLPRRVAGVPRRLEGRADATCSEDVDRPDRNGRPSGADGRVRPRGDLPHQGCSRLQPEQGASASTARWPS